MWETVLGEYRQWLQASGKPPSTVYLRCWQVRRFAEDHPGGYRVSTAQLATWLGGHGWSPATLASNRAAQLPLTLRAGQEIRVVGVCDPACSDLDLRILDPRGDSIALDTRDNARPVVDVRAEMFGRHTIEVGMLDCAAPRCRYAVNVYTR